jgi:hypothetical protein
MRRASFASSSFFFPMAGSVPSLHEIGICLVWAEEENQLLAAGEEWADENKKIDARLKETCFHKFDFLFKKHNNPI